MASASPIGQHIQRLVEIREALADLSSQEKALKSERDEIETHLFQYLDEQGLDRTGSRTHLVAINETTVPSVKDWNAVAQYVVENDATYLFERRLSAVAFRDLVNQGVTIPGVESFTKRSLSLTARK